MAYKNLNLYQFRNIENTEVNLEDGVNIFYGNNGQGKTNFLEALYFLSRGRSFRTLDYSRCINLDHHNVDKSVESVAILKSNYVDPLKVSNNFKIQLEGNKKSLWVNEKKTHSKTLSKICPSVLFSPESLSAIKDGPQQRRMLIDDLIEHLPEYSGAVSQFKKVLRARNKVLSDVKKELKTESQVSKVLDSLNDVFFSHSLDLIELRKHFLEMLKPYAEKAVQHMFGPENQIKFQYSISGQQFDGFDSEKIGNLLKKRASELYQAELSTGYSLVGPQKHDIQFIFNGKDSRYYCSQGQQRALIVAFKIAEVIYRLEKRGEKPVLLLDDVMSELDKQKSERLVDFLKDVNSQIIITTTEKSSSLEKIMGSHRQFYIEGGKINLL